MNNLILAISAVVLLTSCSKVDGANPSQNRALNSISGELENKKSSFLQNKLDSWVKEEWTPTVEKNETIKKKNEDESRNFVLQEYVDKMGVYNKEHNSTTAESHTQKISSMPIIGDVK
ncbi:MAG: hypothetical protein PHQ93_09920 [Sulfurimonas sp.]|uniref:hypothetical protein n=1 Tax=Sulfurimonas sp. TaxID=2022749 RepID=UPI002611DC28|nr:hypothetical protein [Sulfurimonas sp.]MDD5401491.1 hypothetical protein [Sulfurimonas sp.]